MRLFRPVPDGTKIRFMRQRFLAFGFTAALTLLSIGSLAVQGLNLGLDFTGGVLVEARGPQAVDLAPLRARLGTLDLGSFTLQTFGEPRDLMIRAQLADPSEAAQLKAVQRIKQALGDSFEIRRTEIVGPQVSGELLRDGLTASGLAVLCIAVYVWFRFEWQFGLSALLTTFHDVIATLGFMSLTRLQFDLTVVAALLTIAGYSINDTVVVFDRIRENLRRYKSMDMAALIDLCVNQTLSRTVLTSGTTLIAVVALLLFGGPVLFAFAAALAFGIVIGTYSSIFVAASMLVHFPPLRPAVQEPAETPTRKPPVPPRAAA